MVANSDGTIEHILEGLNTPEQVKSFLSRRYSILNQQAGSGYLTMPTKNDPGAIVVDPGKELNPFINNGEMSLHLALLPCVMCVWWGWGWELCGCEGEGVCTGFFLPYKGQI